MFAALLIALAVLGSERAVAAGVTPFSEAVLGSSPAHYWPLNDMAGAAVDAGGANNMSVVGDFVTQGVPGLFPTTGTSYRFETPEGTAGGLRGSDPLYSGGLDALSLEAVLAWHGPRPGDIHAPYAILSQNRPGNANGTGIRLGVARLPDGAFFELVLAPSSHSGGGATAAVLAPDALEIGRAYHVMGVYDGVAGELRLYVDGDLAATVAVVPGVLLEPDVPGRIGWELEGDTPFGTRSWHGVIDEAAVYHRLLSPGEIASHYQALVMPACVPPAIVELPAPRAVPAGSDLTAETPDLTAEVLLDGGCGDVTVAQDPVPGTLLGLGRTTVTISVKDEEGNSASGVVDILVTVDVAGLYPPLGAGLVPLSEVPVPGRAIQASQGVLPLRLDMFAGDVLLTGPMLDGLGLPPPAVVAIVDTITGQVLANEENVGSPGGSEVDNQFKWTDDHWSYRLDSRALRLQPGRSYQIQVRLTDGLLRHAVLPTR